MTQQFGEIDTSQLVNEYSASIVTSGDTPLTKLIIISIFSAVLSSILFIFNLPELFAFTIESIKLDVVTA